MELIRRWETESTYLQPPWSSGDKDKPVRRSDLIKPMTNQTRKKNPWRNEGIGEENEEGAPISGRRKKR